MTEAQDDAQVRTRTTHAPERPDASGTPHPQIETASAARRHARRQRKARWAQHHRWLARRPKTAAKTARSHKYPGMSRQAGSHRCELDVQRQHYGTPPYEGALTAPNSKRRTLIRRTCRFPRPRRDWTTELREHTNQKTKSKCGTPVSHATTKIREDTRGRNTASAAFRVSRPRDHREPVRH